ncbi:MFS transporter [Magnetovibrio sp. PR-2]|uniref:MFS transporter n=1 Tax=Magnetovibrio sp. PR-2 TaxID=3120356 RepID=UPI002FCE1E8C
MSACLKSSNLHKTLYALPAFVLALPTIPVFVLLPTFYADTVGLGLATVGGVFLGLRILDVLSDPLLGWLSDHIPRRFAKRKLPMALGGLVGAPALIMVFSPGADTTAVYLIVWGALLYLAWTAVQIPYVTWAVELDSDYGERAKLNGLREGFGLLGILGAGAAGVLLADVPELDRFPLIAWATVGLGVLVFVIALKFVPEGRVAPAPQTQALSFPKGNTVFWRVLSAWFINGFANGLPAVTLPLFLTYVIEAGEQDKAALLFVYFLFAVLGIQGWVWLARRLGKHTVWCVSMATACLAFAWVPFLGSGDVVGFGVICALTGLTLGSDLALPPAIQADCADWDRLRFRQERTATLFSYWSMATKLALGLAVGTAFPALAYFGLSEDSAVASDTAITALVVIYAVIPIVLKTIAVLMMWRFPITQRRHAAIRRALERRS